MTGKAYYITTLADWQRHAPRFANSHFIVLDNAPSAPPPVSSVGAQQTGPPGRRLVELGGSVVPGENAWLDADHSPAPSSGNVVIPSEPAASAGDEGSAVASESHGGSPAAEAHGFSPAKNDAPPAAGCCSAGFQPANLSSVEAQDFLALSEVEGSPAKNDAPQAPPLVEARDFSPAKNDVPQAPSTLPQAVAEAPPERQTVLAPNAVTRILVLIEADEGVHLSLEDEPAFEPLPHPLAQKPISDSAQAALAPHGVAPGATTFDAAEALARIHPLLRHRVF